MTKKELREMIRECILEEMSPKKVVASKPIDMQSEKRRAEIREIADSLTKELKESEPHSIYSICEYNEMNSMYGITNTQPTEAGVIGIISVDYPESDDWWHGNSDASFEPVAATTKGFVRTLNSTSICKERNLRFTPRTDMCSSFALYFEVWNDGSAYDDYLSEEVNTYEERVWTCWFDGSEVGTVSAATSEEAKEKMMDKYPEYHYGLYDGCFWVEPEDDDLQEGVSTDVVEDDETLDEAVVDEGIFGNKYKGKTILAYRGNGKDEPVAICDTNDRNYYLITFAKAHAKKNNNKEADYKHVSATDMAVKRYGKALKSVPDVSAGLPAWVKQYEAEAREQAIKDSRAAEMAKEREEEARRREAARKAANSKKSWEDDYTYVAGNGTGTYKYKTREGLEESLSIDNIFENLY